MTLQNKGTGAGGANTNLNGIRFEQDTYLGEWIEKANFDLVKIGKSTDRTQLFEVFNKQKQLVAYYGRQGKIYDALKFMIGNSFSNEFIKEVLSAKINPDAFILNINTKTLHIFEKKWQQTSGSVDEKIQTAPFKLEMFQKLVSQYGVSVTYNYILSSFFSNDKFRNVFEYYEQEKFSNISLWVENYNLNDLDINFYLNSGNK